MIALDEQVGSRGEEISGCLNRLPEQAAEQVERWAEQRAKRKFFVSEGRQAAMRNRENQCEALTYSASILAVLKDGDTREEIFEKLKQPCSGIARMSEHLRKLEKQGYIQSYSSKSRGKQRWIHAQSFTYSSDRITFLIYSIIQRKAFDQGQLTNTLIRLTKHDVDFVLEEIDKLLKLGLIVGDEIL